MEKISHVITITIILLFSGCNADETVPAEELTNVPPETVQTISLIADMPDKNSTKIALEQSALDVMLTWELEDEVQLLFVHNGETYTETATVSTITSDKKRATFNLPIPDEITATGEKFDLYGVYGGEGFDNTNPERVNLPKNPNLEISLESIEDNNGLILFFEKKDIDFNNTSVEVDFNHLGSLFSIELKNIAETGLNNIAEVRLTSETGGWAYNNSGEGQYDIIEGKFIDMETAGAYYSFKAPSGTVPAGESISFWGWYPVLPNVEYPELKLELIYTSNETLSTTNSKGPKEAEKGKAYYFIAEWEGDGENENLTFHEIKTYPFHAYMDLNLAADLDRYATNHFVNLETGELFYSENFENLDPVALAYNGNTVSAAATLKSSQSSVTKEEYDSVDPYIFMRVYQQNVKISGPGRSFMTAYRYGNNPILPSESGLYGTPIVYLRVLNPLHEFESQVIAAIQSRDMDEIENSGAFDDSVVKDQKIVFDRSGSFTEDGWSSGIYAEQDSWKTSGRRNWAQDAGNRTSSSYNDNPGTVLIVLHYVHDGFDYENDGLGANVKKFGYVELTNYVQDHVTPANNNIDMNIYWKREPVVY